MVLFKHQVLGCGVERHKKMEPSPVLSTSGGDGNNVKEAEKEPHSHYLDRLANKEGYRSAVYWISGDRYCGGWHNNLRDGRGMHVYKSQTRYEGQWKAGKRAGQGTFWVIQGRYYVRRYRGSWKANYYHGKGLLYGFGGEMYDGEFEKGRRHGMGRQTYRDWTSKEEKYHVYQGQWVNGKREGMGSLFMVNGNVYQGQFKNDAKEGKGVFYFKDRQSRYEGLWRNDVAHAGSYSRNLDPDKPMLPFVMVPNSQHLEKECIRLASTHSLPPHYDRTTKRSDPAVCTRKYAEVSYGSPLLAFD